MAFSVVALVGCAGFVPQPVPPPEPTDGAYNFVDLTRPFLAVGDTQEHESTGFPMHDNDSAIDGYVEVAQRPPEQPLFGRRILEWALSRHPEDPWLHLGDVMDMSCRSEADRMLSIFSAADRPGVILAGNHDGLLFGIFSYNLANAMVDAGAQRWNLLCQRGASIDSATAAATGAKQRLAAKGKPQNSSNNAVSKRDYITLYLEAQAASRMPTVGLKAPDHDKPTTLSWRNPDPNALLSAVEANLLEGFDFADSFMAQKLRLPRAPGATRDVVLIGLDTNQAGLLVSTWDTVRGRSPGSVGHVNPDQIRAITKWVLEASRKGDIVIFAGHHNWQSLGLPARLQLGNLMSQLTHPLVYLSAHTHRGFWALHQGVETQRPLLELNVSSLSDWPIAYRRISFAYDEKANRLLVRGDLMPSGKDPHVSDADILEAWRVDTCENSGLAITDLRAIDSQLVRQQREDRGSLLNWMREAVSPHCVSCELSRYSHAQKYQDELLTILIEVGAQLGHDAVGLSRLKLPEFCATKNYAQCAQALMAESAPTLEQQRSLFSRKARLVALVGDHLDDLKDSRAHAYMTCRAVLAAKFDFDATDDDRNANRGERKRNAEHFFRTEASVGME